jgi:hypothetical protein
MFRFVGPDGAEIANGPLSLLDEALRARSTAEGAIQAAARAAGQMARIQARSDALDQKQHDLEVREEACKAIEADAVRRFADEVTKLRHRFDAIEQRQLQAKLDALPDPDRPADDGDLEIKRAKTGPEADPRDINLEPEPAKAEAETVIGRERDDQSPEEVSRLLPPGNYGGLVDPVDDPQGKGQSTPQPTVISLNAADSVAIHDDGYICGRDRKAARKREHPQLRRQA